MPKTLYAMPMVVLNMGSEMIYVLDQRLQAQQISNDKSTKVLVDVARAMFNSNFLDELFRPQEIYNHLTTRKIFDRLAHSSIMRLNESSMEKLFDLMTMGFKYQVLSCSSSDQILQVTLNHLESVRNIINSDSIRPMIDDVILRTIQTYRTLYPGDFQAIKQELCRFFQDRRIKVSLFLQDGIQNLDGTIIINIDGPVVSNGDIPGLIKYYDANGRVTRTDEFEIASALEAKVCERISLLERSRKSCPYGENLYVPNRRKSDLLTTPNDIAAAAKQHASTSSPSSSIPIKGASKSVLKASGTQELNLLASLLGTKEIANSYEEHSAKESFKINLFSLDDNTFDIVNVSSTDAKNEIKVETITIDGRSDRKNVTTMMKELNMWEGEEKYITPKSDSKKQQSKQIKADEDDLLSLMDDAMDK